ncbi:MAG TPA: hypothetical protein VK571_03935, partial [Gemmatimonadaceae bacterium]|nr:hypothetical protein [Gemmatimonadaceae bacterium]
AQGFQGFQGGGSQGAQGGTGAQGSSGGAQGAQGAQGGTAQINPASIAALQAVDTTGLTSGTLADTGTVGDLYRLNKSPTAGETAGIDATQVVAATTVAGNVWERMGIVSLANAFVAGWFVDDATGNDTNNGTSSITALKTTEELCRRLSPGGQTYVVRQNTAVTIGTGSYGDLSLNVSFPSGTAFSFTINGSVTSSAAITLATVVDTVPTVTPVRGRITTASGTFVDKKRIRSTSGASVGAITYSTGLTSATDTFVKSWFLESSLTAVNIAPGTTCVVDTLTTSIARVQIRTAGNPIAGTFKISDVILANGCDIEDFIVGSAAMQLSQCELGGGSGSCRVNGNIQFLNCRSTTSLLSVFQLIQPVFIGSVIEGQFITETSTLFFRANCFNGGTLHLGGTITTANATTRLNDVEWVNGIASSAVSLAAGTTLEVTGQQFGFGAAYATGFQLDSGAIASTTAVSFLGIIATQQLVMSGRNLLYANVPISFPEAACFFALSPDPSALGTNRSLGFVANWYVDSVSGSDTNDGQSPSTALSTVEGLSQRLCPGGQTLILHQGTTIHLLGAGPYGELALNIDWVAGTPTTEFLTILGAVSSSAPITLSAVVDTAVPTTRGQVTTLSGSFTAGKRIRSTSGAHSGSICFSTGQNASAQNHFVSEWFDYNADQLRVIAPGTTCVVDTLQTTLGFLKINASGAGYVQVQDLIIASTRAVVDAEFPTGVFYFGCDIAAAVGGEWSSIGTVVCSSCRLISQTFFESATSTFYFFGCAIQAELVAWAQSTVARISNGNFVDGATGGKITLSRLASLWTEENIEFVNGGSGTGIAIQSGGRLINTGGGQLWGASTPFAIGVSVESGASVVLAAAANVSFPSTINYSITGHNITYGSIPISYDRAGAFIAINPDPGATAGSQGAQGFQGAIGQQGFQGQNGGGAQGSQGRQGAQGATGTAGATGAQGFQGA